MPRIKGLMGNGVKVPEPQVEEDDVSEVEVASDVGFSASEIKKLKSVVIPALELAILHVKLIGDSPLLVNNKLAVAEEVAGIYDTPGGKAAAVKRSPVSEDEKYNRAFYVMPDSPHPAPHPKAHYGVPTSGIKKCAVKAIRTTGISDNTMVGLLQKSFFVLSDGGGLCRLNFGRLERDVRPVNIGSGVKTVPSMRQRPMFHDWSVDVRIKFNRRVLSEEQIANLMLHAGAFVGLCELRAEKLQGQCGGFTVEIGKPE